MTTLRRELRTKLGEVCNKYLHDYSVPFVIAEKFIEELADAVLEVRGIALLQQPLSIENAIYAEVEVTQTIFDKENIRDIAPKHFERGLGFSKPLPWWSDKDWTAFGEWVCDRYAESRTAFADYNIWRSNQYSSGKLANTTIRSFPNKFYDSWDMFMMSKDGGKKTDEQRPEYKIDSNGVPEIY